MRQAMLSPSRTEAERLSEANSSHCSEMRSLGYWLARHPPGWISRHTAEDADPIRLAREIQFLAAAFVAWLHLSPADRWDTFTLQTLSAALFNRYRFNEQGRGVSRDVDLLDLRWPVGSIEICSRLVQMRKLLAGPFAVFKSVRSAIARENYPLPEEVLHAEAALVSNRTGLEEMAKQLHESLERFRSNAAKCPDYITEGSEPSRPASQ